MNQVTLCGNLGKDFELSYSKNGIAYTRNSLAISKKNTWKEGNSTLIKDHTNWISLTIFGKRAELAHQCFKQGDKFLCNGEIRTDTYIDESGQKKYVWEVLVRNFEFLKPKPKDDTQAQQEAQQKEPEIVYEEGQIPQQQEKPAEIVEEIAKAENEIPF